MSEPRLTIGIPCLNRARFLQKAIDSALAQTVPARILVADQGGTSEVADVMQSYRHNPLVRYERTHAETLWQNWKATAELAAEDGTEFFSYLQDDDVLARFYSGLILDCFDRFPHAETWMARLLSANADGRALWFLGNGPWVPMRILDGEPVCHDGHVLVATAYLTSWALSPAVAFRRGAAFDRALERLPDRCDLVQERLVLAAMGRQGRFVAHPAVVGYWVQHEGNESRRQYPDQDRQLKRMVEWLDDLMDEPGVADKAIDDFETWVQMMPTAHVMAWGTLLTEQGGRYAETMGEILLKELQGRVQEVREMPDAVVAGLRDMRLPEPAMTQTIESRSTHGQMICAPSA